MFLMRDAASTAARLLSLVGSLLFGSAACCGSCSALLISKGHTDCIGLSNCFPLCSKITPLATPSAPVTIRIALILSSNVLAFSLLLRSALFLRLLGHARQVASLDDSP